MGIARWVAARWILAAPVLAALGCATYESASRDEVAKASRGFGFDGMDADSLDLTRQADHDVREFGTQLLSLQLDPPTATPAETPAAPEAQRLKIYKARLQVLVASPEDSIARLLRRVEELGGYLERREDAAVTCRVPAARFRETIEEVRGYGRVTNESIEALDVTKQHFDLKIRIQNAETARTRLLALLERAEKVEDALKIESELRRLSEEIDRLKAELTHLADQVAYSTISVTFLSSAPPAIAVPERRLNRFRWINLVGVEHVLYDF